MSEALHEAAHAVAARVLPSPFLHAEGFRVRNLKEIIQNQKNDFSHVLIDHKLTVAGIRQAYNSGNAKQKRVAVRLAFKNCIILMAGEVAEGLFLRVKRTTDENFDHFWDQVSFCINEKVWGRPRYKDEPFTDAEWVAMYLGTVLLNEYGTLDEVRLNGFVRGLYHISHRAVKRNWWCIKSVAGNAIYTDGLSAKAVNFLIDRLAIGYRSKKSSAKQYPLVCRVAVREVVHEHADARVKGVGRNACVG